jgi:anti-anti-sigma factor
VFDELELTLTASDDGVEIRARGEIDSLVIGRFRQQLVEAASAYEPITVDLTGVTYLDSAGVAVLFDLLRRRRDVQLVAGPGCLVQRVLEVTGLASATNRPRDRAEG